MPKRHLSHCVILAQLTTMFNFNVSCEHMSTLMQGKQKKIKHQNSKTVLEPSSQAHILLITPSLWNHKHNPSCITTSLVAKHEVSVLPLCHLRQFASKAFKAGDVQTNSILNTTLKMCTLNCVPWRVAKASICLSQYLNVMQRFNKL